MICVLFLSVLFFFKQKTAYELRISDWSSDVCSSDLAESGRRSPRSPTARGATSRGSHRSTSGATRHANRGRSAPQKAATGRRQQRKIGRASCRERVCQYV